MNKDKDVIMISNTDSEYIDKVILILNNDKKRIAPKELLLKQAERIIYEYENKNAKKQPHGILKLTLIFAACFLISAVTCYLGMRLFF